MSDRGVHPDLLEEVETSRAAEPETPAPEAASRDARARGPNGRFAPRGAPASANPTTPGEASRDDGASPEGAEGGERSEPQAPDGTSLPEWFQTVRESTDPQAALAAILKNVPLEELQKHPQISGWIGNMAQRVSREQAARQAAEDAQKQRQDAWRRGDYYRLGELEASTQEQLAQQAQLAQASEPFMQQVTQFQMTLPQEVQAEVSGKQYPSFAAYFEALNAAAVKHAVDSQVAAEIKKRQAALDKMELSATVGSEPMPEREGGPAPRVREITDAEIGRMTLAEYNEHFDANGRPKPGRQVRFIQATDVTRR
jgi:hypothetical protein